MRRMFLYIRVKDRDRQLVSLDFLFSSPSIIAIFLPLSRLDIFFAFTRLFFSSSSSSETKHREIDCDYLLIIPIDFDRALTRTNDLIQKRSFFLIRSTKFSFSNSFVSIEENQKQSYGLKEKSPDVDFRLYVLREEIKLRFSFELTKSTFTCLLVSPTPNRLICYFEEYCHC